MEPTATEPAISGQVSGHGWVAPGSSLPPTKRPWWKRKWGITAIVIGSLLVIGSVSNAMNPKRSGSLASASPLTAAVATGSPTPTVEPSVEATSEPTATTVPTAEPTAEPTVEATEEPIDEATEEPIVEPEPTAEPSILKKAGRGDKIVKFTAQDAPTFARITGKGAGNFAVISYAGSDYDDLLVNEIGSYSGWVYVAAGVNRLKVSSSGTWTIEVRPILSARTWDGVSRLTGKGDAVAILTGGADGITTIKNKSKSNFAVIVYGPEGDYLDLLVNEIGSYSGEVLLPGADPMVLSIHAVGGTWSLSPVEE